LIYLCHCEVLYLIHFVSFVSFSTHFGRSIKVDRIKTLMKPIPNSLWVRKFIISIENYVCKFNYLSIIWTDRKELNGLLILICCLNVRKMIHFSRNEKWQWKIDSEKSTIMPNKMHEDSKKDPDKTNCH